MLLCKSENLAMLRKMQDAVISQIKNTKTKSKVKELKTDLNAVNEQYGRVVRRRKELTHNTFEAILGKK